MKGTISEAASKILRDPEASAQLDKIVNSGGRGEIVIGSKTYTIERASAAARLTTASKTNQSRKG